MKGNILDTQTRIEHVLSEIGEETFKEDSKSLMKEADILFKESAILFEEIEEFSDVEEDDIDESTNDLINDKDIASLI